MKHEDALKLMEILFEQDFTDEFVFWTLIHCEEGMGIGHAMYEAARQVNGLNE